MDYEMIIQSLSARIAQLEVDKAVYKSELVRVKLEMEELQAAAQNKEVMESDA